MRSRFGLLSPPDPDTPLWGPERPGRPADRLLALHPCHRLHPLDLAMAAVRPNPIQGPTSGTPWPASIAWGRLGLGLACLALFSSPPQALARPSANTANPQEQAASSQGPAGRDGGFGSWQSGTRSCSRNLAGAPPSHCQQVQLDQQLEGLLTVRFIAPGAQKDSLNQLIVVGLLQPNSAPLVCQQGLCQLAGPLNTLVSTVSERSFDGRGLAEGLPKAWLASGSCRFEGRSLRCEAAAADGQRWQANANF